MYCSNCGAEIKPNENFCRECGQKATPRSTTPRQPEPTLQLTPAEMTQPQYAAPSTGVTNQPTKVASGTKRSRKLIVGIIASALLLLLVAIPFTLWLWFWNSPPGNQEVVLRLHGSNTIGAKLVPALAEEFLKQQGAKEVQRIAGKNLEEVTVQGILPEDSSPKVIEVQSYGSTTAFEDLAANKCDIGLASRKIKPDEVQKLTKLGDMTLPANEHVLALDGIAVIINSNNPITALAKDQIAKIFTGEITDWTQVLGSRGQIKVYARDDNSGTYDTFKSLVLGSGKLVNTAARFEDSNKLSDSVSNDVNGIGFIGLPYIRNSKAIAVSEGGATPLMPNRSTVATEDYVLTRRLYLYTPTDPQNALTRKFVEFALSQAGQEIVEKNGFVAQTVKQEDPSTTQDAPEEYQRLTSGAQRLSLNFRFRKGSKQLDNKALLDIDRVVAFLGDLKYTGKNVMLLGFADNKGTDTINDALSKERASTVADEFKRRGITPAVITGFGAKLSVASNDTEEGRDKNRRVEIWLKP